MRFGVGGWLVLKRGRVSLLYNTDTRSDVYPIFLA